MQAITHIAPVVGLVFTVQAISAVAGIASPFALAFACLAMATVSVSVIQLSRRSHRRRLLHLGQHGAGASVRVCRGLGLSAVRADRRGINLAFLGGILQSTFAAEYGFDFPWWVTALVGASC